MDYRMVFQISSAGMSLEKRRVDIAALNLANVHATAAPGQVPYMPQRVTAAPLYVDFASVIAAAQGGTGGRALREVSVAQVDVAPRLVQDPGHPHANAAGFVSYAPVDQATEMLSVVTALRAYEANVAVASSAKAMAVKALEIGGQG